MIASKCSVYTKCAMNRKIILVTGPARSGKSQWAENLASKTNDKVLYLATGYRDPQDPQWCERISIHQQRRSSLWSTTEEMIDICPVILSCEPSTCLLLDSLGSWVANLIEQDDQNWQEHVSRFLQTLQDCQINLILVAEETGWGVVPAYPIGRLFRDRLGELVQKTAPLCDSVYLVTAGHALNLSKLGILIT